MSAFTRSSTWPTCGRRSSSCRRRPRRRAATPRPSIARCAASRCAAAMPSSSHSSCEAPPTAHATHHDAIRSNSASRPRFGEQLRVAHAVDPLDRRAGSRRRPSAARPTRHDRPRRCRRSPRARRARSSFSSDRVGASTGHQRSTSAGSPASTVADAPPHARSATSSDGGIDGGEQPAGRLRVHAQRLAVAASAVDCRGGAATYSRLRGSPPVRTPRSAASRAPG